MSAEREQMKAWWYRVAFRIWSATKWLAGAVAVTFLVSVAANAAVVQWKDLPDTTLVHVVVWLFQPGLPRTLLFASMGGLLCVVLMVRLLLGATHAATTQSAAPPPPPEKLRETLISIMQRSWIRILEQSLQGTASIELGLQEQLDAITLPYNLEVEPSNQPPRTVATGEELATGFRHYDNVLILGEPGSGKTTLLLELARELLEQAKQDQNEPVPLVFPLASWAGQHASLADWLVEELRRQYGVKNQRAARSLIEDGTIRPLLDGLDEVPRSKRSACLQEIDAYRGDYPALSIVLCCRSAAYFEQKERVRFQTAVTIKPLTDEQIERYLSAFGELLTPLRTALQRDGALRDLARTPFVLRVLVAASQGNAPDTLLRHDSPTDWLRQVFANYVDRMLAPPRGKPLLYPREQVHRWLAWLAQQVSQHGQTPFYLEQMQPTWLPRDWRYGLYRLIVTEVLALVIIEAFFFIGGPNLRIMRDGFLLGTTLGLVVTYLSRGRSATAEWSWKRLLHNLLAALPLTLIYALVSYGSGLFVFFITVLFLDGLFAGCMTMVSVLSGEIIPVDLVWSPTTMERNFARVRRVSTFILLAVFVVLFTLTLIFEPSVVLKTFVGESSGQPLFVFILKLIALPFFFILVVLLGAGGLGYMVAAIAAPVSGFSNRPLETSERTRPNQGIWRSGYNGLRVGLLCLVSTTLGVGIVESFGKQGFIANLHSGLLTGLDFGIVAGVIVSLFYGGAAFIKHGLLRFVLWGSHDIPWNYPRFLDFAAERHLLWKIGEGYLFPHRLLLDYFLPKETNPADPLSEDSSPAP